MTTRITGHNGEMILGVYVPPRMRVTIHDDGTVFWRPATTWEITRWQIRNLVRRMFP